MKSNLLINRIISISRKNVALKVRWDVKDFVKLKVLLLRILAIKTSETNFFTFNFVTDQTNYNSIQGFTRNYYLQIYLPEYEF